jgi:hypothetical protein
MSFLRFLMFLSLIVWVGGIIFLSFVEAPTAFHQLPSRHMAGGIVGHSLGILHWMGLFSGVIFLGSSLLVSSLTTGSAKPFAVRHLLVCGMLLLTAVSQFGVSPKPCTSGRCGSRSRCSFSASPPSTAPPARYPEHSLIIYPVKFGTPLPLALRAGR